MLDIVPRCNPVQYHEKPMMQTWENHENTNSGTSFVPPNFFSGFYLHLDIVPSYHPIHSKGKQINLTWENYKKPNFGLNFGPFDLHLGPKYFFRGFYVY